jgi:hypothetical protein
MPFAAKMISPNADSLGLNKNPGVDIVENPFPGKQNTDIQITTGGSSLCSLLFMCLWEECPRSVLESSSQ